MMRTVMRTVMRSSACLLAGLLLLTAAGVARGETLPLLETQPDSALAVALRQVAGESLPLSDAVGAALEQSTEVRVAEADLAAAIGALKREKGSFDPELFAALSRSSSEAPTASFFAGAEVLEQQTTQANGGARVLLPIGTRIEALISTNSLESNSSFVGLDPEKNATTSLTVRQPLLKGFGPATSGRKDSADQGAAAALARYEDARAALRAEVESTYWTLYAAERDLAAQIVIQDRARLLMEETDLRAKAGLVARGAVANSSAFLAESDQGLLDREEAVATISDRLATLMGRRPSNAQGRFHAHDAPPSEPPTISVEDLLLRALADNRSVAAAERDLDAARARARAAKWNALPQLDVFASVGGYGLAGEPRDSTAAALRGGTGDAISDAFARDYPNWSAGVEVSLPIGLRAGRGERDRATAEMRAAEQRALGVRRQVEENVRTSWRELTTSSRRLDAAQRGVDASLEQVRLALIQYRNGATTAFEVVNLGADLVTAQQRYSAALVRAAQAWAEIRRLTYEEAP